MFTTIPNTSPYTRMRSLAYEVSVKELRKKNLESTIKKLYPDDTVPDYSSLFQAVIDHLKVSVKEAFSKDERLSQLKSKIKGESLEECARRYTVSGENMRRIEEHLRELGYEKPSKTTAEYSWCLIL